MRDLFEEFHQNLFLIRIHYILFILFLREKKTIRAGEW